MKRNISPVAIAVIAVVVVGALIVLGMKAMNTDGPAPTPQQEQAMNEFRDQNAAKTGGVIDENSGMVVQPTEQRTSEEMARESGR